MKLLAIVIFAMGLLAMPLALVDGVSLISHAYATGGHGGGDGGEGDGGEGDGGEGDGGEGPSGTGAVGGGEGPGADCQPYHCGNITGQTGNRRPQSSISEKFGLPF